MILVKIETAANGDLLVGDEPYQDFGAGGTDKYKPDLVDGVTLSTGISLRTGFAAESVGDITIKNVNGEYDSFLNSDVTSVTVFEGKQGLLADMQVRTFEPDGFYINSLDEIELRIKDLSKKFEVPVSSEKISSSFPEGEGQYKPTLIGHVARLAPVKYLIQPNTPSAGLDREWYWVTKKVAQNPAVSLYVDGRIANKTNYGYSAVANNNAFKIDIDETDASIKSGPVSCVGQGEHIDSSYESRPVRLARELIERTGTYTFDETSYNDLDTLLPYDCGVFITTNREVKQVVNELLAPHFAGYSIDVDNTIRFFSLSLTPGTSVLDLTDSHIEHSTITIKSFDAIEKLNLGYAAYYGVSGNDDRLKRRELRDLKKAYRYSELGIGKETTINTKIYGKTQAQTENIRIRTLMANKPIEYAVDITRKASLEIQIYPELGEWFTLMVNGVKKDLQCIGRILHLGGEPYMTLRGWTA